VYREEFLIVGACRERPAMPRGVRVNRQSRSRYHTCWAAGTKCWACIICWRAGETEGGGEATLRVEGSTMGMALPALRWASGWCSLGWLAYWPCCRAE
jgi:hypothetical protein